MEVSRTVDLPQAAAQHHASAWDRLTATAFATPALALAETGERIPLTDGDAIELSEFTANYFIIADAVLKCWQSFFFSW